MKRLFTKHLLFTLFAAIAGLSLNLHAQTNPVTPGGAFKFHGIVGPSPTSGSVQKPTALMVADVPAEKVKKECVFFGGDSLKGFDFAKVSSDAALDGAKMYSEFRAFMFLEQAAFIKKKYDIKALPYEIRNEENKKSAPPVGITASCNNLDFENGNFGGWTTARGYNSSSGVPLTVMQSPTPYIGTNDLFDACDDLNIITSAYGNDPYGGFPGLNPNGGTYSARLGGRDMNTAACVAFWACDATKYFCNTTSSPSYSNGEQLSQTFLVTAANALISFDYAVLLCDGGHAAGQQCYFQVAITDAGGGALSPAVCYSYYVEAIAGVPPTGFVNSGFTSPSDGTAIYKQNWTSNSINLTPYIGTNVTMRFMAAGCVLGGHPAWAYIDATCGAVDIDVTPLSPCIGSTGVLTAPAVMNGSYSWSGPGIVGSTTGQSVTVNATGTYFVTVTPSQGVGCQYTLSTSVTFASPSASISASSNVNCFSGTNGSATVSASGGTPSYTYAWSPSGGNAATANNLSAGNYTIVVTDNNGCTATSTVAITQPTVLTNTVSASMNINCNGGNTGSATASPGGGSPGYTYAWSPSGGNAATANNLVAGNYTVLVTDNKGCTKTATVAITQPTILTNTISSSTPGGCGVSNGTATASPSGGSPGYTYLWSPTGQNTQTATGLTGGTTYTVLVTDNNGCTKSSSISIGGTPAPTIATTSATVAGCGLANGTANVSASGGTGGLSYSWSSGGQTTATATGLAGGNYTITVTDANGCSATGTASVSSTSAPAIATVTATAAGCGVSNGTATANATGGTGAYSYSWTGGQTTQTATALAGGNYNVTVTDAQGCSATGTVAVTNSGAPTVSNISSSSFGCSNPYGVATVSVFGGTPGYSFAWSPGGQTTQTATGLAAGPYTVVVTDANNCSLTTGITVTVTAAPTATLASTQATCGNNNGTATANFNGGTPGYTYLWSNGATTSAVTGLAPGNYSVSISDNSCNVSGIELVTNGDFSAGDVGFSSTYTVCVPNCAEGSYAVGTNPTSVHAAWASCADHTTGAGNFMIVNGAPIPGVNVWCQNVTVTPNTNYTFSTWVVSQYTISPSQLQFSINGTPLCGVFSAPSTSCTWTQFFCTWNSGASTSASICILNQNTVSSGNDFGLDDISFMSCTPCVVTATVTVPMAAALTASVTSSNLTCNGNNTGNASVTAITGTPNYSYSWSSGQSTSAISNVAAGNYTVTVTDLNGCASTNTLTITQPNVLASTPASTPILCNGGTSTISISPSGGTPNYTYNWSNGQTTSAAGAVTAGSYSVTVSDANGCTTVNTFNITQPAVLATGTSQSSIGCNGGTANASVTASGGTTGYTYSWSSGQSTSAISGVAAGNYSVLVTDANGCTSTNTLAITQPTPLVLSGACSDSICAGDTAYLSISANGGTPNYTYVWLPGPMGGQAISVSPSASSVYFVTITDANGCTSTTQTCSVTVLPAPNALFDTTSNGLYGATYQFGDMSNGGSSWFWDFGDGGTSTLQNPIHTFPGSGTYTVTQIVFNQFGCPDTFKIILDYNDGIIIPNVFTPDGDGINDVWYVPNSGLKTYHVEIFDRWGLKVFENVTDEIRWDGRSNAGVLLTDGTYYYVLTAVLKSFAGDKDYSTKGYITLLTQTRKQ